jgi:hypothetical protein
MFVGSRKQNSLTLQSLDNPCHSQGSPPCTENFHHCSLALLNIGVPSDTSAILMLWSRHNGHVR